MNIKLYLCHLLRQPCLFAVCGVREHAIFFIALANSLTLNKTEALAAHIRSIPIF